MKSWSPTRLTNTIKNRVEIQNKGDEKIMNIAKEEARKLINKLPDQATWDDIMYEFYVRKKIEVALKAAEEGRIVPHEEVKKRFLP